MSLFVQNHLKLSNGDDIHFWCIEWNTFQQREEVFTDPSLREQMKLPWTEFRPPLLRALGKTEEELTWEEDLQVFFECTGAERTQRRVVIATVLTDKFLGLDKKSKKRKLPCMIL